MTKKNSASQNSLQKRLLILFAAAASIIIILFLILFLVNKNTIEFQLDTSSLKVNSTSTSEDNILLISDQEQLSIEYGSVISAEQIKAVYKGTIFNRKGKDVPFQLDTSGDLSEVGNYTCTLTSSYGRVTNTTSFSLNIEDTTPPEITLVADPDHFTSPIASYEEEGYSAIDLHDGDITDQVVREEKDGFVYYTVTDSFGNTADKKREIVYKDVVPPVITLNEGEEITVQPNSDFSDPGYTAADDCDGDITANVTVEGTVDTHTLGDYALTYSVKDSYDNEFEIIRKVHVADTLPPSIKLNGEMNPYILVGSSFSDAGYSAYDEVDGDVTAKVTVDGSVNTSTPGTYNITYRVTDNSGNQGTAVRSVTVYKKATGTGSNPSTPADPGSKVIYLTFDDGPGPYTGQLLDILDKYNVKATFFVTNAYPGYQNMIGEEARRGHTVGIHTYTHDYAKIYASESAYISDMTQMNEIIKKQTGSYASIFRFPGGSSNQVSKKYNTGIMTRLTSSLTAQGYQYYDWNVSSGDAGGTTSKDQVVANVTSGCAKKNISVVLQHDIKSFSVNAVEEIIQWGQANGYTFRAIDSATPVTHHPIAN